MKINHEVALAILASLSTVAAGGRMMHAQQAKASPAYLISEADAITDPTAIREYGEKVSGTLTPFHGHYHFLVGGGKIQSLDGDAPQGIVVIAFDSAEQARAWYDSPAYAAIRPIRQKAVKGRMFIVEGLPPSDSK